LKTIRTEIPEEAAAFIRSGDVVAFPTETVYGLGANALDASAVIKIFKAKGRPSDNPLIVHIARTEQISELAKDVPDSASKLIERFFPGPLTVVLKKKDSVPDVVTGGLDTVGIRMPLDETAARFLEACGVPVAAPSANRSGKPSPTTWQAVLSDLDGLIPCILIGDPVEIGIESTVVDCTQETPVLLRTGAVTFEQIRSVVPEALLAGSNDKILARSPGTKYRHYAPSGQVQIVATFELAIPGPNHAYIGLDAPQQVDQFGLVQLCDSVEHYAYRLYDFFRACDAAGIHVIYCQDVEPVGLGRALHDRLNRASSR